MNQTEKKQLKNEIRGVTRDFIKAVRITRGMMEAEIPGSGPLVIELLQEQLAELLPPDPAAVATGKKAMLCQPMAGKSDEEIVATRERAIAALEAKGYTVINTLFADEWYAPEAMKKRGVEQVPLCFLAKSLENMSKCHAAYFCAGWQNARGCRVEHQAAVSYGLELLYEEEEE